MPDGEPHHRLDAGGPYGGATGRTRCLMAEGGQAHHKLDSFGPFGGAVAVRAAHNGAKPLQQPSRKGRHTGGLVRRVTLDQERGSIRQGAK